MTTRPIGEYPLKVICLVITVVITILACTLTAPPTHTLPPIATPSGNWGDTGARSTAERQPEGGLSTPVAPTPQPTADSRPLTAYCATVTADEALNIRAQPDSAAQIIGWLQADQVVQAIGSTGQEGWLWIKIGDLTGWANSHYLILTPCIGE